MELSNAVAVYVALAALAGGVLTGWTVRDWRCDAAYAEALEKANKAQAKKQEVVNDVAETYETGRAENDRVAVERHSTIREIYRASDPVPVDCSAPDAVRRVLEGGVSAANAAATGQPVSSLSDPASDAVTTGRP